MPPVINGFTAGQKAALKQARENTASGIPAVVLDAVVPEIRTIKGLAFQPFVPRTYAILRKLGSAFTGASLSRDTGDEIDDVVRTIYVMTTPIRDVKAAVAQGIERLTEIAYDAVGECFELKDVPKITEAIACHISGGFTTVPGGRASVEESGDPKASAAAPAPAAPAAAGGSA